MFKAIRTVYFENDKRKVTAKEYATYEEAVKYAKRYGKLTSKANFVKVDVKSSDDDMRILYSMDSNGFENEYTAPNEEEVRAEKEVKYLVNGMNGFEFVTSDLQEARKVLYNNCFRFENTDIEFAVIELNSNGGRKNVIVEGKSSDNKQRENILDFVLDLPEYKIEGFTAETEEEATAIAETVANEKNEAVKIYKYGKEVKTVKPFTSKTYELNGRNFTLETKKEAITLAQAMANDKNRVVRINRNGVEIAEVKPEQKYNFYITDYTEDRELPTFYEGYTKKEITNMVKEWSEKNNHVYKIYIYDRTSDKGIAGRVFFKVINWKQIYKVGKTGSRLRFGEFSYEEAEKYCKEYAEKDGIAYTIYKIKIDKYGRDDVIPVINIYPPEKIAYYGVFGYSRTFDTLDEAVTYAENQRSKSELTVYKAVEIDCGLRVKKLDVRTVPAYKPKEHIYYELIINKYDENGDIKNEDEAKFKTLEEASSYVDELIKSVGDNKIKLELNKVEGDKIECLFTKIASKINGMIAVMKDTSEGIVAEKQAKYITDSELISMLVKEPVNANLYDFMREPERIKVSKNGKKKLRAIREIVKRALVAIPEEKQLINTPNDAANLMMKRLRYETKEKFYIIILNTKNKVVNISRISEGSLSGSIVHPANVFKEVLKYETASSIILCHNHPSGEPVPSMEDINITLRLIKAGRLLDIEVLDHIVIGDGIFKSMKQEGIIRDSNNLSWQATACESR